MAVIIVLGIGPGSRDLHLVNFDNYLKNAQVVIGSQRQLASLNKDIQKKSMLLPALNELKIYLLDNSQKRIVILASGDPLLYGIGSWIKANITNQPVKIILGISSIQYCFHQLGISMNNSYLTSSHGRKPNFDFVLQHEKIGMVTDQYFGPREIAAEICKRKQKRWLYVGENLSYPDERITKCNPEHMLQRKFDMNVVIITNA